MPKGYDVHVRTAQWGTNVPKWKRSVLTLSSQITSAYDMTMRCARYNVELKQKNRTTLHNKMCIHQTWSIRFMKALYVSFLVSPCGKTPTFSSYIASLQNKPLVANVRCRNLPSTLTSIYSFLVIL